MNPLIDINKIFDSDYLLFYPVIKPYDFEIQHLVVDSFETLDSEYYDVFDAGDSVIIGFKNINGQFLPSVSSVFITKIVRESGKSQIIEMEDFSNMLEIFGLVANRNSYLYWVMDSVIISDVFDNKTYSAVKSQDRCDVVNSSYGPWRFEVRDGIYETSYDYDAIPRSSFFNTARIISSPGDGHIIRLAITGDISAWTEQPITTIAASSIVEAMQIMRHWSFIYNMDKSISERVAVQCSKFDDNIAIPQNVIESIDLTCPNTTVSKYFSGIKNSREKESFNQEAPEQVKNYLLNRVCYSTISSLYKNCKIPVSIDQSIINRDKENVSVELMLFLENNDIQHSDKSVYDLLNELVEKVDSGNWTKLDRVYEKKLFKYIASVGS